MKNTISVFVILFGLVPMLAWGADSAPAAPAPAVASAPAAAPAPKVGGPVPTKCKDQVTTRINLPGAQASGSTGTSSSGAAK